MSDAKATLGDITYEDKSWRREAIKQQKQFQYKSAPPANQGVDWSGGDETVIKIPRIVQSNPENINVLNSLNVSIELEGSSMSFGDDIERYLENQIEEKMTETLSSFCFDCESKNMHDEDEEEYYCPMCNR